MLRVALTLATTASAAVAATPGGISPDVPASGFGGRVAVHLANVGHIEIALGSATSCYIGR